MHFSFFGFSISPSKVFTINFECVSHLEFYNFCINIMLSARTRLISSLPLFKRAHSTMTATIIDGKAIAQ